MGFQFHFTTVGLLDRDHSYTSEIYPKKIQQNIAKSTDSAPFPSVKCQKIRFYQSFLNIIVGCFQLVFSSKSVDYRTKINFFILTIIAICLFIINLILCFFDFFSLVKSSSRQKNYKSQPNFLIIFNWSRKVQKYNKSQATFLFYF